MTYAIATADPISQAALSLRDDPTFGIMSSQEAEQEARDLLATLGGDPDDPLSVALVLEQANAAPATVHAYAPPAGVELCGEKRERCNAAIAANGRCMECGAHRAAPDAPEPPKVETPARPVPEKLESRLASLPRVAPLSPEMQAYILPTMPLLYRVKLATGLSEYALAELIGKSRATVQSYISGRNPEILDAKALEALTGALDRQAKAIADLQAQIRAG